MDEKVEDVIDLIQEIDIENAQKEIDYKEPERQRKIKVDKLRDEYYKEKITLKEFRSKNMKEINNKRKEGKSLQKLDKTLNGKIGKGIKTVSTSAGIVSYTNALVKLYQISKDKNLTTNEKIEKALSITEDLGQIGTFGKLISPLSYGADIAHTLIRDDISNDEKIEHLAEKGIHFSGNLTGPIAGAKIGKLLGKPFGIAGSIIGGIIGGAVGVVGGKIADKIYEKTKGIYSGIFGKGDTGGVEFIYPEIIKEFRNVFAFEYIHYIAFKVFDDEKCNIQKEVINLINSKFLINGIKVNSLEEIFETILKELSYGLLFKQELPFVSLNFNNDHLLYSIMNDYYQHTLTGHIITFLDYFLKCYVNGGFFEENFVYEWYKTKNKDLNYLNENLIEFRKYIYENYRGSKEEINYISMNDLIGEEKDSGKYKSAFRIIGKISKKLEYSNNIIFPNCFYDTEYDFDINADVEKNDIEKLSKLENKYWVMTRLVKIFMNKVPFLRPYFELLKLITFGIHYLPNLQESGLFPDFSESIQQKFPGQAYIRNIPPLYPPLPIEKRINIEISFDTKKILSEFSNEQLQNLNIILSANLIDDIKLLKINVNELKLKENSMDELLTNIIKNIYKRNIDSNDQYILNFYSDEQLDIKGIKNIFFDSLINLMAFEIIGPYANIYNNLKNAPFETPIKIPFKIDKILNFKKYNYLKKFLQNDVLNLLHSFTQIFSQDVDKVKAKIKNNINQINIDSSKAKEKVYDQILENTKTEFRKKYTESQINIILTKNEFKQELNKLVEKSKNEIENKRINLVNELNIKINGLQNEQNESLNKINKMKNELLCSLDKLEKTIINKTLLDISKLKDETGKCKMNIHYNKVCYEKNLSKEEKYANIIGGCKSEINNDIYLLSKTISDEIYNKIIHASNVSNQIFTINDTQKYYIIKSKVINGFVFGHLLNLLSEDADFPAQCLNLISSFQKDFINSSSIQKLDKIKDKNGKKLIHYLMKNSTQEECKSEFLKDLTYKADNSENPELIAVKYNNIEMVKKLVNLPNSNFAYKTAGGMSPLILAILNEQDEILKILLNEQNIVKNDSLNYTNELKKTVLHYACEKNLTWVIQILLSHGADYKIQTIKEGNNPFHILCINGFYNSINAIININKNFIEGFNLKTPEGKSSFHFATSNSAYCTKYLLNTGGMDLISKEKVNNLTPLEYAFYSGRIDNYFYILYKNRKFDKNLVQELNEILESENKRNINSINKEKNAYEKLILCFKNCNENIASSIIEDLKKNPNKNIPVTEEQKYKLVKLAFEANNLDLFLMLTKIINLKKLNVVQFIGEYGKIGWIDDCLSVGINLFYNDKNELYDKNIFDYCIKTDDKELLIKILDRINSFDNPGELLKKDFENIISDFFTKSLINKKAEITQTLLASLKAKKFEWVKINLSGLTKNINTTPSMIELCYHFSIILNINTLNIEDAFHFCRPSVCKILLTKINNINIDSLLQIAIKYNRYDNLITLCDWNLELYNKNPKYKLIKDALYELESLLQENSSFLSTTKEIEFKNIINNTLKGIKIELIELPISKKFLPHLIIENKCFWALSKLNYLYSYDLFITDDQNSSCFDSITPEFILSKYSFNNIKTVINYFESSSKSNKEKTNNIIKLLFIFSNSVKELCCEEQFFEFILTSCNDYLFTEFDENNNNIFHVISSFSKFKENSNKLILNKLIELKRKDRNKFNNILCSQDTFGNTIIMNFLINKNIPLVLDIIKNFKDDLNINQNNKNGDSILHLLLKKYDYSNIKTLNIKFLYNILVHIISMNPKLIISENRQGEIP